MQGCFAVAACLGGMSYLGSAVMATAGPCPLRVCCDFLVNYHGPPCPPHWGLSSSLFPLCIARPLDSPEKWVWVISCCPHLVIGSSPWFYRGLESAPTVACMAGGCVGSGWVWEPQGDQHGGGSSLCGSRHWGLPRALVAGSSASPDSQSWCGLQGAGWLPHWHRAFCPFISCHTGMRSR